MGAREHSGVVPRPRVPHLSEELGIHDGRGHVRPVLAATTAVGPAAASGGPTPTFCLE